MPPVSKNGSVVFWFDRVLVLTRVDLSAPSPAYLSARSTTATRNQLPRGINKTHMFCCIPSRKAESNRFYCDAPSPQLYRGETSIRSGFWKRHLGESHTSRTRSGTLGNRSVAYSPIHLSLNRDYPTCASRPVWQKNCKNPVCPRFWAADSTPPLNSTHRSTCCHYSR
jgi:hypothetical protein